MDEQLLKGGLPVERVLEQAQQCDAVFRSDLAARNLPENVAQRGAQSGLPETYPKF